MMKFTYPHDRPGDAGRCRRCGSENDHLPVSPIRDKRRSWLVECHEPGCRRVAFLERYEARDCQVDGAKSYVLGLADPSGVRHVVVGSTGNFYHENDVSPEHVRRGNWPPPYALVGFFRPEVPGRGSRFSDRMPLSTSEFLDHPVNCLDMLPGAMGPVGPVCLGKVIDVVPLPGELHMVMSAMAGWSIGWAPWAPLPKWMVDLLPPRPAMQPRMHE